MFFPVNVLADLMDIEIKISNDNFHTKHHLTYIQCTGPEL